MRGHYQRDADPAWRTAEFSLMPCENDFLAQRAQHLDSKGFVADREIDTAFVAQRCTDYCLFIQGSDHRAIDGFQRPGFWSVYAVLEGSERLSHVIAAEFVRVANTRPQIGIS